MSDTEMVYMNFNPYKVMVRLEGGTPLYITQNNGVKGKRFEEFAKPKGPLTAVPADRVAKPFIIRIDNSVDAVAVEKSPVAPLAAPVVPKPIPLVVEATPEPVVVLAAPVEVEMQAEEEVEVEEEIVEPKPVVKRRTRRKRSN